MQPKTEVKFDRSTFDRIKRTIKSMSVTHHKRKLDGAYAVRLPEEVGIQLTNRCNLRCKHCFQWNDDGFFNQMTHQKQNEEIALETVTKIFEETRSVKSNLYLWGGEPLVYKHWDELANLLAIDPRWTVLCTNGTQLDQKMESLLKISSHLAVLLSVDGFIEENDAVRGKGTFNKVINNIKSLMDLKNKGEFKGEVSVNCVISENMANRLYEFMEFFENLGVNTVYFCFPWYLPQSASIKMDSYFKERFNWLHKLGKDEIPSWYSYKYRLRPDILPVLLHELKRIHQRVWKVRIRLQPALEVNEIKDFVLGNEMPAQKRKTCLAVSSRMNVLPSGDVTVCKLFPEFTVGNLNTANISEIWHSDHFKKCREIIGCGLMPVCSKCILLYLNGR